MENGADHQVFISSAFVHFLKMACFAVTVPITDSKFMMLRAGQDESGVTFLISAVPTAQALLAF